MTRSWQTIGLGFLMAVRFPGWATAQVPVLAAPPGSVTVPSAPPPIEVPPPAPPPSNLWSYLCPTPEQEAYFKVKFCNSMVGKLLNGVLLPASALSGGLIQPICATPNPLDLSRPPDSLEELTARLKKEEMEAGARRAHVRFLGSVDWQRYPEAEKFLVLALRTDPSEGVRLEAANALANGCCCTRSVVEALLLTVNGSERDGNPVESSPRVRHLASVALAHCLRYVPPSPEPLEKAGGSLAPVPVPTTELHSTTGKRGLFDIFGRVFGPLRSPEREQPCPAGP